MRMIMLEIMAEPPSIYLHVEPSYTRGVYWPLPSCLHSFCIAQRNSILLWSRIINHRCASIPKLPWLLRTLLR